MKALPLACLACAAQLALLPGQTTTAPATSAPAPAPVVAVYDLEGVVSESGISHTNLLTGVEMDGKRPMTFLDVCRSMEAASRDPRLAGVVLELDGASLDLSQIQELRRRLLAIRQAGKPVWMYAESFRTGTALIGTTASRFTLMPEADCQLDGLWLESMYFKQLLDRIGVRAEVIHVGDYKSFGETLYRSGPSEAARKQDESLVNEVFEQLVSDLAQTRSLPPQRVLQCIDLGSQRPQQVVDAGLADGLASRTEFTRALRETFGETAKFNRSYAMPNLKGPEINGLMDVFQLLLNPDESKLPRKDFIAVVPLEGDITDQSVAPLREWILKLAKAPQARGLVLRVNSPGGSALASEVLWEATSQWKATGKPFAVSMGGTAASGGYYASCAADRIFAEAGTLTGSIGVVGMKWVFQDALNQLGITTHAIQRGKFAGASSPSRSYSPEEQTLVRASMEAVYQTFKQRVQQGRGPALKQELESLAGGRVFTGSQALKVGLVDEIGGLTEAIAWVTGKAAVDQPLVRMFPAPKSAVEGLFAPKESHDDDFIIRASPPSKPTNTLQQALLQAATTSSLPAHTAASLHRLAQRLQSWSRPQVLMLAPDHPLPNLWR